MDIWHCLDINSTTFNALSPYRRTSVVILLLVLMLVVETPRLSWSDEAQDRSRELLAKGWQQFDKHVPAHYAMALRFFNQAKEAEPGSAEVDAALATLYWRGYEEFWFNVLRVGRSDARLQAKSYLEAALRSPTAVAHQVDCRMKAFRAKHDEALAACERAIALDPAPAIAQLSMQAVGDAMDNRQRALRLTQFVHQYLDYRDATSALTVDDIVEGREGDCTEYAELFTTLARAIGLPARTVSGLVYRDEKGDRLVLHAWNEVVIDDHWFSVDPTWNEFGIDAAHLRFPLQPDRLMRAHGLLPQMRFKVIEVDSG